VQRLKTRPQFQAAMAGGIVSRTAHFALHRSTLDAPVQAPEAATGPGLMKPKALFDVDDVWMGAMVPKRWARRAVTRNAIKRQIYNVSATFEPRLSMAAHVVRLRSGFDKSRYISATSEILKQAVRAELEQLFQRVATAPAVAATEPRP
jgi:ribonuclease P protein component